MVGGSGSRSGQERLVLLIVGWVVVVVIGFGLLGLGYLLGKRQQPSIPQSPIPRPTVSSPLPAPTAASPILPTPVPTVTPLPEVMPTPTPMPAMPTSPPQPVAVVGENGANVRSGPGTNFTKLGYLEPGTQVPIIGHYADWWQIEYSGAAAWVYSEIVAAANTDGVAEVQPPASPTPPPASPATAAPTSPPPTQAPADYRGVHPDKFEVEGAPGPYKLGQPIWFNMWITNRSGDTVEYEFLGVQVEETGEVQKSWVYSEFKPNQQFYWRDQMQDKISAPGTYHLWLVIRFRDGAAFRLLGPVVVTVQQ